jgi:hypothetical protein
MDRDHRPDLASVLPTGRYVPDTIQPPLRRAKVESFGKEESPMGRAAQPAELAPAYVFLASQEPSYITGEVIKVTGGNR